MLWLAIGFAIVVCVALNLTQWPRKKLDRLQELAEADFAQRTIAAEPVCGEHAERFSLEIINLVQGPVRFEARYRSDNGEMHAFLFGPGDRQTLLDTLDAMGRDPDLGWSAPEPWRIYSFILHGVHRIITDHEERDSQVDKFLNSIHDEGEAA
jgi:hypothetical protein